MLAGSLRQRACRGSSGRTFQPAGAPRPARRVARAEPSDGSGGGGGGPALSEDVIARLRAAEEEAARLKKQLADLQSAPPAAPGAAARGLDAKPQRIDGTDSRETLFAPGGARRNSWLSEEDVDFITGGGPSEAAASAGPTAEQQALIKRRALIGGAAAAGLGAFALVPTKDLRLKPSKPMYFYLTALLRVQSQLGSLREYVDNAEWDTLRLLLPRIEGPPGDAKAAMYDAIALLDDRSAVARAEEIAADVLESIRSIDAPHVYYDAIPRRVISGTQNAEFVRFSAAALARAQGKLNEFLAAMPREAVAAARAAAAAEAAADEAAT
ncbi:hypothetical protein Rsub_00016 [Raphidocelis subcapitata]|uniref:Uncharacterized protein n=1 Tax=Raphidocelis subcapitata TaxID=307507 RepID=A0A2V0NR34_9CHLO|nr:hypothetical protein Rsub_00016 [Raphidocelis subcapitata]|eukprot:GBF87305.1 hypothetical protein Rsub_00016 [Raphidocelis subcapitata]